MLEPDLFTTNGCPESHPVQNTLPIIHVGGLTTIYLLWITQIQRAFLLLLVTHGGQYLATQMTQMLPSRMSPWVMMIVTLNNFLDNKLMLDYDNLIISSTHSISF